MQNGAIRAVIFDMDGLMLDTEPIAKRAWQKAASELGYDLNDDLYLTLVGRNSRDGARILTDAFGDLFPLERCKKRRDELYLLQMEMGGVPIKKGLKELLRFLKAAGIKTAVATSTSRQLALHKLKLAGILDFFETVVAGDEIENGKPAPDIFIKASTKLGVAPKECVVLEDSVPGVRAALAAGMTAIMVPDLIQPDEEIQRQVHHISNDLFEAKKVIADLLSRGREHDQ